MPFLRLSVREEVLPRRASLKPILFSLTLIHDPVCGVYEEVCGLVLPPGVLASGAKGVERLALRGQAMDVVPNTRGVGNGEMGGGRATEEVLNGVDSGAIACGWNASVV